jgi:glycosyltransferase involved in cell wall biosynthesis
MISHQIRILMVHNYYQQRGGEDESVEQDIQLLREHGHEVDCYTKHNDEIDRYSLLQKSSLLFSTTWSGQAYREIEERIRLFQPDVIHSQNFFPLISPSMYDAAKKFHIPVVQTLRNYRLMCCNGLFFRDGKMCELCLNRIPLAGVRYGCYRDSRIQSLAVALMIAHHRLSKTWQNKVSRFITLGNFAKGKFIEGGLPAEKISIRPNFLQNAPEYTGIKREGFALFIGRLSAEKGIQTLLKAWKLLLDIPLVLVGDGPMKGWVEDFVRNENLSNVLLAGRLDQAGVFDYLHRAEMLIVPSEWYETFGRVVMEAFASGTPVIASRIGALQDLVAHEETGLLFQPGDSRDLAAKVRQMSGDKSLREILSQRARVLFKEQYSSDRAYTLLMEIYAQAINSAD